MLFLRRTEPPPKSIDSNVLKALINLRKDPDRVVLSADKGNCVVVMDKHQYHEKALSLLNDKQTYTILKSDPTGKTERDLNQRLLLLKKSNKISEVTYKMLRSSDGLSPRLYGLPKIRLTQTSICHLTRTIREAIKSPWQQPCFREQKV